MFGRKQSIIGLRKRISWWQIGACLRCSVLGLSHSKIHLRGKVCSAILTGLSSSATNQPLSAGCSLLSNFYSLLSETHMKESDGTTFWLGAVGVGHTQNKLPHRPLN